jgi:2-polyprenyl-6-methoxyphenol hydroxylase-like FAD-dependent oxidoreductase
MRNPGIRDRYDVVIAGARVAGASTALLLARAGMRVLVVDPLPRGRDTLSTHALMRGGVFMLARWGLLDAVRAAGTPVARTTSFYYPDESIRIPIKPADGVDGLYSPRRTVLDPILADAAERAGATVVHGYAVSGLARTTDGRIRGVVITGPDQASKIVNTDLVIGADGLHSKVARLVDARITRTMPHAAAAIYGHWPGLGLEGNHWHFASGLGAGAIPTNGGDTCLFACMPADRFAATPRTEMETLYRDAVRTLSPDLDAAISMVKEPVRLRAFAGEPGFLRQPVGPGWALVGDAAYFRDPFTAHGMTDAMREAEFLARAILSADDALDRYETERDERVSDVLEITDRIASFEWDTQQVKALHIALSKAMTREVDATRALDAPGTTSSRSLTQAV